MRNTLTQEYLKSLLDYNPETGAFTWKLRSPPSRTTNGWNTKFAGTLAGSVSENGYLKVRVGNYIYFAID